MFCVTAYPCVSTSVPLTYVWAFGFVGCILFDRYATLCNYHTRSWHKVRWPTNQKSKKRSLWSEIILPGTASQKLGQSQPLRQSHQGPSPTIPMRLTKFFAQILQRIVRSFQTRIRQVGPRGFFLRFVWDKCPKLKGWNQPKNQRNRHLCSKSDGAHQLVHTTKWE